MTTKAIYIRDLYFEHEMWKKELNFCADEIAFLTKRLEEITFFHEDEKDMLREVEQFQNQFIVQKLNIDRFTHDINKKEHELAEFAKDHPIAVDHVHFEGHAKIRDNMEGFTRIYNELKQEFRQFLVKWK